MAPSVAKRALVDYVKWLAGVPQRRNLQGLDLIDPSQFSKIQEGRLSRIYRDAKKHVRFYRESSLYPADLEVEGGVYEALSRLPILEKETVKSRAQEFQRGPRGAFVFTHTTGGTTGTPLKIREDIISRGLTNAILETRYEDITGLKRPRTIRLTGRLSGETLWQRIPGTPHAYLSIYRLTEVNRAEILGRIRDFQPNLVHGYASSLSDLAALFSSGELRQLNFKCVSTSETLYPEQRIAIEENLGARVYNEYGSQEGQHLIFECEQRGMHVHPYRGVVEILKFDSDEPAKDSELGRVVVSGLQNRQFPLFRYSIGDSAISREFRTDCPCGSKWPLIGDVHGRIEDLVRARDGRRIGHLSGSTIKHAHDVKQSQIVQMGFGDFVYKVVPAKGLVRERLEAHVLREMQARLLEPVRVKFEYVDEIERTAAGKQPAVVVKMK